jgi:hypothetical protein
MQQEKIAVIGIGRLGMSLAIACREAGPSSKAFTAAGFCNRGEYQPKWSCSGSNRTDIERRCGYGM